MATLADIAAAIAKAKGGILGLAAEAFDPAKMVGRLTGGAYGEADPETEALKAQAASPMPEVAGPAKRELLKQQMMGGFAPGHIGALGLIKGAGARDFPHLTAVAANRALNTGATPLDVHGATGLWRAPTDPKLRAEINDVEAALTPEGKEALRNAFLHNQPSPYAPLHKYFYHPEAYASYPEIAMVNTRFLPQAGSAITHFANPTGPTARERFELKIGAYPWKTDDPVENARLSILHELTHGIQALEGMQGGGSKQALVSPNDYVRAAQALQTLRDSGQIAPEVLKGYEAQLDRLYKQLYSGDEEKGYLRIPGEAEARMVEKRSWLTPAQRKAFFPPNDYDVPIRELLSDWPVARR